jgi:hypothetical protein
MAGPNLSLTPSGSSGHIAAHGAIADIVNMFDKDLTPNDGDIPTWNGTSGLYEPEAPSGGSGVAESSRYWLQASGVAATDDANLATALTTVAAETYPRTITLAPGAYTFTTANRVAFDGLRIEGPPGYSNPERGTPKAAVRIALSMTGPWFVNPLNSDVFSCSFHNLSFSGGSNAYVLGQNGTGTWYCLSMQNIFSSGLKTVLGSQATKILMTAASFTGDWEINNCYNGAFHIGGSDNVFWSDGMLLDSGTAFNTAGSANGQYQIWFDFCEKSDIGPLYITCEGAWNGIRVSGPSTPHTSGGSNLGGPLSFTGLRLEGRNAGAACNGAVFRQEGGMVIIRDSWIGYGMVSPTTPGHSPADAGVIHVANGVTIVDSCTYDKATSVALTVPFVYVAAGEVHVNRIMRASKGGSWTTSRPVVDEASTGLVLTSDATVTVT